MKLDTISWEKRDRVVWLTLARQEILNAMDFQTILDLNAAVNAIEKEPDTRIVVITGAGRSFSTGIDLKELSEGKSPFEYHQNFERALRRLETMEKIVLAAINGWCLGGGLQLALACDLRAASSAAVFALPAVVESLIPGLSTYRLPRFVGMGRAKRLILTGDRLTAQEAWEMGLVDYVFPVEEFHRNLDKLVEDLLKTASVGARKAKVLTSLGPELDYESFLARYLEMQYQTQTSQDHAEAMMAYKEKREPKWS